MISYRPMIEKMVWSYSRISSFDSCPYGWRLKYIRHLKADDMFYASYGSFIHKLIERFYLGELTKEQMLVTFVTEFKKEVKGARPKESTLKKYIECGKKYLSAFEPFPFNMLAVEKYVEFECGGSNFIGYIDYVGEKDGEIFIVDNKSRDLRPRSNRKKPTLKDIELDTMLRQLYLYSIPIEKEYGKLPKALCFNCFKSGTFIEEPFDINAYNEAKKWAGETIESIKGETEFNPKQNLFYCTWICGLKRYCKYYYEMLSDRR